MHTRISVSRTLAVLQADKTNVRNSRTAHHLICTTINNRGSKWGWTNHRVQWIYWTLQQRQQSENGNLQELY